MDQVAAGVAKKPVLQVQVLERASLAIAPTAGLELSCESRGPADGFLEPHLVSKEQVLDDPLRVALQDALDGRPDRLQGLAEEPIALELTVQG